METKLKDDIHAALMKWVEAVEGRDLAKLPEIVYQEADLVWIGTDKRDWYCGFTGLQQGMQAQNDALKDIKISISDETIHARPGERFAWATNHWLFRARADGQWIELPVRCTWILEKRDGAWKIVHFHKSVGMEG